MCVCTTVNIFLPHPIYCHRPAGLPCWLGPSPPAPTISLPSGSSSLRPSSWNSVWPRASGLCACRLCHQGSRQWRLDQSHLSSWILTRLCLLSALHVLVSFPNDGSADLQGLRRSCPYHIFLTRNHSSWFHFPDWCSNNTTARTLVSGRSKEQRRGPWWWCCSALWVTFPAVCMSIRSSWWNNAENSLLVLIQNNYHQARDSKQNFLFLF